VTECFTAVSGINAVTKPFLDLLDDRRIDIAQVEALISLAERLAEVVGKGRRPHGDTSAVRTPWRRRETLECPLRP
jgi:hypothetical protein